MWPSRLALVAVAAVLAALLASCGRTEEPDLVNGKAQFVQKCGSCHALSRAGTQGQTGPDLDRSFQAALGAGMNRETVEGVVYDQIENVLRGSKMPANLVKGESRRDVSAYVGFAAARTGEDTGRLAQAGLEDATDGEDIFVAAGCGSCHVLGKARTNGNIGPNLDELKASADRFGKQQKLAPDKYVEQSLLEPDAFTAPGFPRGVMPAYEGRLKPEQVDALVKYLLE